MIARPDTTPLRQELTRRREASLSTPDPIHQTNVARSMGVTSSHISRLERGKRSLHKLTGEEVGILLRGYGYTALEIKSIVERYRLNMPPDLVEEEGEPPPGLVTVMHEGSISYPHDPRPMTVPDATKGRYDPQRMRLRSVKRPDLVTEKARRLVSPGDELWTLPDAKPRRGVPTIVRQGDARALVVWPLEEITWALPLDSDATTPPLRLKPGAITVERVVATSAKHYL